MRLDYQILELLHPHYVAGKGCVYDHINWTIWVSNKELLDNINETFDYSLELGKKNEVKEEVSTGVWHYIQNQKRWVGTYGTDYDRDILEIY